MPGDAPDRTGEVLDVTADATGAHYLVTVSQDADSRPRWRFHLGSTELKPMDRDETAFEDAEGKTYSVSLRLLR